jgi:endonuclease/exonuclease/phosphatase (EEP) superfamily protein YafD
VFAIDPDKPDIPPIARILSGLGLLCLLGSVVALLLAFSGYTWVTDTYAMAGALGAFLLAVVMIGQAKTIELLAVVSARVKSRFAIERAVMPATAAPTSERKLPPVTASAKERVISIPEDVARQQGVIGRARDPG